MKQYFRPNSTSGQSLLEIVVSVGLVTMVLVALVSAISFSLANAQFARNKALATKYDQEAVEWLREQRDASWFDLNSMAPDAGSGQIYCVPTLPVTVTTMTNGTCTTAVIDDNYDIFHREVTLRGVAADDSVSVTLKVWWYQGAKQVNVTVNTTLTRWQ